jgi:hypothetical protein
MSSRKAKKASNKLVLRPRESKHGSKRVSTFNHNKHRSMYAWGPRLLFAGRSKRRAQEEADPNGGQEEDANSDGSQEETLADYDEDSSSNDPLVQQEDKVVPPVLLAQLCLLLRLSGPKELLGPLESRTK